MVYLSGMRVYGQFHWIGKPEPPNYMVRRLRFRTLGSGRSSRKYLQSSQGHHARGYRRVLCGDTHPPTGEGSRYLEKAKL
jgi:hypothetical protein